MLIKDFKNEFSHKHLHLNNAGLAPITKAARNKINYWSERFYEEGFFTDHDYMEDVLNTRHNVARLIGSDVFNIAFFQSTASAISQLAFHYPLEANDEVITWACEYGSNLYPWQEACKVKNAKLILVSTDNNLSTPVEKIIEAISPKTKVIAISWVQYLTGAITDIEKLSKITREKNIFLFVDVMQGLGLFPLKMKEWGIDAIASGSHKWLFSPVGVGFLALDEKYHALIKPHNIGASTYGTCDDPTDLLCVPKKDALKFEAGSKQVLEITALGASIELILKVGVENILLETNRLSKKLRKGLEELGHEIYSPYLSDENHLGSIVNFSYSEKTLTALKTVPCLYALRGPGLRLSPAAFNTDADIEKVLSALK